MPKAARKGDTACGHGCFPPTEITASSGDVIINGQPAARVGDPLAPHGCKDCSPHGRTIAVGSSSVFINGKPAARVGDGIDCGGVIISGSGNVHIGDNSAIYAIDAQDNYQALSNQKIASLSSAEWNQLSDEHQAEFSHLRNASPQQAQQAATSSTSQTQTQSKTLEPDTGFISNDEVPSRQVSTRELTNDTQISISQITYKVRSLSGTAPLGGGYMHIDFGMVNSDGSSQVTFSGSVLTTNMGVGADLSFVESDGVLEGPKISWSKASMLKALDRQTVTGDGFTFSIFNGFVLGGEFNIGPYSDPSSSFQVRGISVGWEGFRGTLKLDPDSFSVTKINE